MKFVEYHPSFIFMIVLKVILTSHNRLERVKMHIFPMSRSCLEETHHLSKQFCGCNSMTYHCTQNLLPHTNVRNLSKEKGDHTILTKCTLSN